LWGCGDRRLGHALGFILGGVAYSFGVLLQDLQALNETDEFATILGIHHALDINRCDGVDHGVLLLLEQFGHLGLVVYEEDPDMGAVRDAQPAPNRRSEAAVARGQAETTREEVGAYCAHLYWLSLMVFCPMIWTVKSPDAPPKIVGIAPAVSSTCAHRARPGAQEK